ncbi:MAG: NUDIX hydrolase [Candidatus Saccharimonadales bacterium]
MAEILKSIALGVIQNNGNILVIQRKELERGLNDETLTWVFPGGKVESSETVYDSVIREVYEETGYKVKATSTIDEKQHPTFPAYVSYVACELVDDNAGKNKDMGIAEVRWVSISEFQNIITSTLNSKVKSYLGL